MADSVEHYCTAPAGVTDTHAKVEDDGVGRKARDDSLQSQIRKMKHNPRAETGPASGARWHQCRKGAMTSHS